MKYNLLIIIAYLFLFSACGKTEVKQGESSKTGKFTQ